MMTHYEKLGILAIRWMAVGLLALAFVYLLLGLVGPWTMASMMGFEQEAIPGSFGHMMGRGMGLWWGPTLLTFSLGGFLWGLSRPIGRALGAGLGD